MKYTKFTSSLGEIILVGDENGLRFVHIVSDDGKRKFSIEQDWQEDNTFFSEVVEQLKEFLQGKRYTLNVKLNAVGTEFQKKVWHELGKIPYGETRTYQEIAAQIGKPQAARAIGMANSKNPLPLFIPCHRVIGASGKLTGFAHGLSVKEKLLQLENSI